MRRAFASAFVMGALSIVGLAGCGDESKVETETTIETPEGSKTITDTTKVETDGSMSPDTTGTPVEPTPAP